MDKLTHDQFQRKLTEQKENPNLIVDSASYDLYENFWDILFCDGGDDDFAHYNSWEIAFELGKLLDEKDIEDYDNDEEILTIYLRKKDQLLTKWGWK